MSFVKAQPPSPRKPIASIEELPDETTYIGFYFGIGVPQMEGLLATCDKAVVAGAKALYLAFGSAGGTADCGIVAREQLLSYGVPIVTHNMGNVDSAAIPLFLAGEFRLATTTAVFRFHRVYIPCEQGQQVTQPDAERVARELALEEQRLCIVYDQSRVTDGASLMRNSITVDTSLAMERHLIHAIGRPEMRPEWSRRFVVPA